MLESVEQVAGLVGPLLAGVLATYSTSTSSDGGNNATDSPTSDANAADDGVGVGGGSAAAAADADSLPTWFYSMVVVTACYVVAFIAVVAFYRKAIVLAPSPKKEQ